MNQLKLFAAVVAVTTTFSSFLRTPGVSHSDDVPLSNAYDSITYCVFLSVEPIPPLTAGHLFILHDSILSYIQENLSGINVEIRRYPNKQPEDSRFKCFIFVGEFNCYSDAEPLKEKLISDGFTKSAIIGIQCRAEYVPVASLRKITAERCNEPEHSQNEVYGDTLQWDSITYRIRIKNCKGRIEDEVWDYLKSNRFFGIGLEIVKSKNETYHIDACYDLQAPSRKRFARYEDAVPLCEKIISDGYKDAYIAAYLCNNEIDLTLAK